MEVRTCARKAAKIVDSISDDASQATSSDSSYSDATSLRGVKNGSRYVPGVPMSREELSAWRKEARRVRNRESAAASRQKTRKRIEELEDQVRHLQSKYGAALERILELEDANREDAVPLSAESSSIVSDLLGDLATHRGAHVSPEASPSITPRQAYPNEIDLLPDPATSTTTATSSVSQAMISRPTARVVRDLRRPQ